MLVVAGVHRAAELVSRLPKDVLDPERTVPLSPPPCTGAHATIAHAGGIRGARVRRGASAAGPLPSGRGHFGGIDAKGNMPVSRGARTGGRRCTPASIPAISAAAACRCLARHALPLIASTDPAQYPLENGQLRVGRV